MRGSLRLGNLFGIPFYIDYTWFFIAGLLTLSYYFDFSEGNPGWAIPPILVGLLTALGLFGSVLAHELAHSLVALSQGISVKSITLFIFGGMATIEKESQNPWAAFWVAIAGPLMSFGLFLLLQGLLVSEWIPASSALEAWASNIAMANAIIACFNLVPGLPLDGGQILKAVVWGITGDRHRGVLWAARSGQLFGWGFTGFGLWLSFTSGLFTGIWIGLIGLFMLNNARRYAQYTQLQQILSQLTAREAMRRDFRVVDVNLTLREFAEQFLLMDETLQIYFADADGRYKGMVDADGLRRIERSRWDSDTVASILVPMDKLEGVPEDAPIGVIVRLMADTQQQRIPVLSPTGAIAGLVDKGDIVASLGEKLGITIAPDVVQRVRDRDEFPLGFPIDIDVPQPSEQGQEG
jgi:Zn-dependent protease